MKSYFLNRGCVFLPAQELWLEKPLLVVDFTKLCLFLICRSTTPPWIEVLDYKVYSIVAAGCIFMKSDHTLVAVLL